mgnify:CR=1 FL=1
MNPLDPEKTINECIAFLQQTFAKTKKEIAVIGLSGGVDSSIVFVLTLRALGVDHVVPMLLPYGGLGTQGILDTMELLTSVSFPITRIVRIDIKKAVDALVIDPSIDNVRRGNMMTRVRMIYLFDQAKKRNGLVVGTENKTEHLLGYYTRFGDNASDVEPIIHLYKTEVIALAKHLGVPQSIIAKKPSADLWPGQTDEAELGASYEQIDRILNCFEQGTTSSEDIGKLTGIDTVIVARILHVVSQNIYKQHTPYKFSY